MLLEHIKVEEYHRPEDFKSYVKGSHIVETHVPIIDDNFRYFHGGVENSIEIREMVQAKIIAYFYGNVLRELNELKVKHSRTMEYEVIQDIDKLIADIYTGRIVEESEVERPR